MKLQTKITVMAMLVLGLSLAFAPAQAQADDSVIWAWGSNGDGQSTVPDPNTGFTAVAGGWYHSLGLETDGSIAAWGSNGWGQCDVPDPNTSFTAIAGGWWHSLGLKTDGSIVAWGQNTYGQCDVPDPNTGFTAIAGGSYHSLGLKTGGSIVAWGDNTYGQCDVPDPNTGFTAIAAGRRHSLGLKTDGSIVAWGDNEYGQCNVPDPNTGFTAIAVGSRHSLGLKTDGSIVAWGDNSYGQSDVPDPNTGFTAIATYGYHSLGLKTDGSVVAWGDNGYGQSDVPEPNTGFTAIAAGGFHSLGLNQDSQPPPVVVTSSYSGGYLPKNVVDADYLTIWRSQLLNDPNNETEWIYVDYNSPKTFDTVRILWGVGGDKWQSDYAQSFNIQVSNDATNWTTKYSTTNGGKGLMLIPIGITTAQYVKIECTAPGLWNGEWGIGDCSYYMIGEISTYTNYPYSSASSSASGYEAHKARDGDLDSGWRSSAGGTQSLTLTYEDTATFCFATIVWGDTYPTSYTVEVNDSNGWETVYSVTDGDGGVDDFWLEVEWVYDEGKDDYVPKPCHDVRLTCTAGGASYEVREFRVSIGYQAPEAFASEAWAQADMSSPDDSYLYCPGMVTDGGLDPNYSRWASGNYAKEQVLCIDMGSEQTFSEMKLYWNDSASDSNCTISGSTDGKSWTELDDIQDPNGGDDTITFTETTARFVKVEFEKDIFYKANENYPELEEWPFSVKEIYIIPGALATSCWSYEWGPQVPFKAVDGDLETAWCSMPPWGSWGQAPTGDINDQTITIDYGVDGTTIDTVILHWTDWFAKSYSVDVCDHDQNSWTSIYSTTEGNGGTDVIVLASSVDVNYMRVHCTERGDETVGYALKEIEAVMRTRMSDTDIDYGSPQTFNTVRILWNKLDNGQDFRIQTSNDASSWTTRYSSDNGGEGLMLLPIEKITARYVRIQHYESSSWNNCWSYMIADTSVYLSYPYGEASSNASGYEAYKAQDDDLATGWRSSAGGTQSYTLTYENPTKLCFATIIWGDTYATSYTVEVNDGNEWSTGYSTTSGDGGIDDIWLDVGWHDPNIYDNDWNYVSTPQLKVRLTCTAGGASYEVREFRVSLGNQYPQVYASEAWKNADAFDSPYWRYQYCPGFLVNGGIDGDYCRWATGNLAKYQDICIDMGSEQTFDEIKIYWQADADCNDYTILGSTNGKSWTELSHQTSTTGDVDSITFTEATARFVKLELDNIVDRPYSIKELYIIPGTFATSCRSDEWGSQVPFRAVDGDLTTGWYSVPPWGNYDHSPSESVLNDQTITIDYGQDKAAFNTIILHWGGWFARSYSIDSSDTLDANWTNIYSTTIGDGSTDLILLDNDVNTQFLRVHCTKRGNTKVSYSLEEIVLESRIRYPVVTASSTEGSYVPANAIDDSDTSRWASSWSDPQWIQIDYGQLRQFDEVRLYWENAYGKSYQIQTSDNGSSWTTRYSTTTGDGGIDLIDLGQAVTARYIRMYATERGTGYGYSLYDFRPQLSSPPVKLATADPESLTASSATASSQGGSASNAIDASDATRWASDWSDPQWIRIDLGESKQFNQVRLYWETAYGKSYLIQTSDDDSTWTTHYSTTSGQGGDETVNLDGTVTARYVRMYGTERGTGYGYSLYDFRPKYAAPGKRLLVNGQPFIMKGVCYGGTPVGMNYHYNWSGDADMYNTDLPLLEDIGCNVIRLYQPPLYPDGMDAAYEKGIYVLMGYDIAQGSDITDPNVRNAFKSHFLEMVEQWKDHPAVLMWSIANEYNVHVGDANKPLWYALVDECAAAAKQIEGNNYHPVTTVNVEVGDLESRETMGCADSNMPNLDVWSVNVYRGRYFFDLFALDKFASWTDKPMCITEFGCDVYDTLEEQVNETPQAEYMRNWWVEMLANGSGLNPDKPCIGGTLFQYADDWNKQGDSSGHALWPTGGCWNLHDSIWDPNIQNLKPNWEDEWVGIVGIAPDTYEKTIREAYYSLQEVWNADANSDNFASDTQSDYTWFGDTHSYDDANEWVNTSDGANGYVAMNLGIDANSVATQADFCFTDTADSNGAICAFVRVTAGTNPGSQDSYCAIIDVNDGGSVHSALYRTNGGTWTSLVSGDSYPKPGLDEWHTIRFAARDNFLTLFIDGHNVFSYEDTSGSSITAAGDVSIKTMDGDAYIDNYFAITCGFGGDN